MGGNLNMGGDRVRNMKDPQADQDGTTRKYVDDRLKHSVQSADTSNAFKYVMDNLAGQLTDEDDIKGINKTDKDFHKINKETFETQLLLDSRGYYSSRLGVNMYLLPILNTVWFMNYIIQIQLTLQQSKYQQYLLLKQYQK